MAPVKPRRADAPSDATVAYWARLYNSGLSTTQVGDRVGKSGVTVLKWLTRAGVTIRDRAAGAAAASKDRRRTDIRAEDLREMYDVQRLSLVQIAQIYHTSVGTISDRMDEAGIDRRPAGPRPGPRTNRRR